MTLLTWEEEEILHKVRELDRKFDQLTALVEEILEEMKPTFRPPVGIVVIPAQFDTQGPVLVPVRK
jgi:hypothetical protein